MRKIFTTFLLFVSFVQIICSQSFADSQSIDLQEVQVNANRDKLYSEMGRVLTIITRDEIISSAVQSLDQLLDYVAGIDIRQRGTNATQADISIRGGSFDQVLVLLNGINITDPQTGHHNLNIPINLSDVSRIEILQGSSARVLGPNAFSGAINIVTEKSNDRSLTAGLTGGSYQTFGQTLSGSVGNDNLHTFASVSNTSSKGYMANTDYHYQNLFSQTRLHADKIGYFDLQLAAQLKDFGANSFYALAYPMQFESTKTFMTALSWNLNRDKWTYNAQVYWRRHHDRFELFRDSVANKPAWYKSHNYHMTDVTGGKGTVSYFSKIGKTMLGMDIRNEHIYSNVLGTPIDSMKVPFEKVGYFTKANNRLTGTVFVDHSVNINHWYFSLGAAGTNSTTFGLNYYGGVDVAYAINDHFRIFFDANSAVRLPTFTDLYYKSATQIANPDLQPEQSQTIEIGVKLNKRGWQLDATVYKRFGQNVIDWVKEPDSTKWQSQNLTRVNALGLDMTLNYTFEDVFIKKVSASYSYLQMDKSADDYDSKYALDYLKNKFIASVEHKIWNKLSAVWKLGYLDRAGTYTDKNDQLQKFKPYFMLDCRLLWNDQYFDVFGDLNNILNTTYADYGGLAQPGVNVSVGVRVKL
ncbi:MAG: TonB-dependent receptor [Paludibacteraceae bacterium]